MTKQSKLPLKRILLCAAFGGLSLAGGRALRAADWTMWGRTPDRDMITPEKGAPTEWDADKGTNVKWVAQLGSKSYGNPIVTNGMVFVGTNNEAHKDAKFLNDAGVLMCFSEADGKFLWQRISPKLPTGRVNDWPGEGLCSTVLAEGGRIYFCTNRCEVVCLDVSANGEYKQVWVEDMIGKLGVFPHNMTSCAILPYQDKLYVITGNGVDDTHKHVVAPQAPAIVCFKKSDGSVVWTDNSPKDTVLHGQWASPALAMVNGKAEVVAPLGDGWIYAYEPDTGKIIWKFDSNPKDSVYPQTRNELIATPVIYKNRLYIANGQDPEHGEGPGHFWCVDITKTGDISYEVDADPDAGKPKIGEELVGDAGGTKQRAKGKPNPNSGVIWSFHKIGGKPGDMANQKVPTDQRMNRTIATAAIDPTTGLLFIPDFSGMLHCLDAETGEHYWTEDLQSAVWGSSLICDGKVYQGSEDGFVRIYKVAKQAEKIAEHDMGSPVYSTPVFANGTLYIMSRDKLFAISDKK